MEIDFIIACILAIFTLILAASLARLLNPLALLGASPPPPPTFAIASITHKSVTLATSAAQFAAIEVNGVVAACAPPGNAKIILTGLSPSSSYRVRLWTVKNNVISPSNPLLFRTKPFDPEQDPSISTAAILSTYPSHLINTNSASIDTTSNPTQPAVSTTKLADPPQMNRQDLIRKYNNIIASHKHLIATLHATSDSFSAQQSELSSKLESLKQSKRILEASKLTLRTQTKNINDSKRVASASKSALDRIVLSLTADLYSINAKISALSKESSQIKSKINNLNDTTAKNTSAFLLASQTIHNEITKLKADLESSKKLLASKKAAIKSLPDSFQQIQREIDAIDRETRLLSFPSNHINKNKIVQDKLASLIGTRNALLNEQENLQASLSSESKAKVALLHQLSQAKRNADRFRQSKPQPHQASLQSHEAMQHVPSLSSIFLLPHPTVPQTTQSLPQEIVLTSSSLNKLSSVFDPSPQSRMSMLSTSPSSSEPRVFPSPIGSRPSAIGTSNRNPKTNAFAAHRHNSAPLFDGLFLTDLASISSSNSNSTNTSKNLFSPAAPTTARSTSSLDMDPFLSVTNQHTFDGGDGVDTKPPLGFASRSPTSGDLFDFQNIPFIQQQQ